MDHSLVNVTAKPSSRTGTQRDDVIQANFRNCVTTIQGNATPPIKERFLLICFKSIFSPALDEFLNYSSKLRERREKIFFYIAHSHEFLQHSKAIWFVHFEGFFFLRSFRSEKKGLRRKLEEKFWWNMQISLNLTNPVRERFNSDGRTVE